jgi:DNA (cytosine-5)-methyltransferase 1
MMQSMPKVIDLYAGAGGLSLSAARAGFRIAAAVELDPFAVDTHTRNFPQSNHLQRDVATLSGKDLLQLAGLKPGELDGLIGGPPCQGFSVMGRKDLDDSRSTLFGHFFRLVAETKPAFFVAENVPGLLNDQFGNTRVEALRYVPKGYRVLRPIEVVGSMYGAATTRRRVFFVGYKPARFNVDVTEDFFLPTPDIEPVNVSMALTGLPTRIDPRWQTEALSWRPVGKCKGRYFADRITNAVPQGVGNPASLERYFKRSEASGCFGTRHSDDLKRRYGALRPGEMDEKTKSRRLDPDGFCPTIRAGTDKDKGSFQAVRPIHFSLPRVITPREAARLQGFPDWFVFQPTKWHSFRQLGNSVSPIVGERVLAPLACHLR